MATVADGIKWLEPFELCRVSGAKAPKTIASELKAQLSKRLRAESFDDSHWQRCVYVIRMRGDFLVSYPGGPSPVLYIGEGFAFGRLSSHLKNWLYEVEQFGRDVSIEIRICRPRRRKLEKLYRYIEADLILMFQQKYGALPFFNRQREKSCEGRVDYTDSQMKDLRAAIGIGRGRRPRWSIEPLCSNKNFDVYWTGHSDA